MISLAQTALMGIAGYMLGNMVTQRRCRRRDEGSHARLGSDPRARRSRSCWHDVLGIVFGAVAVAELRASTS